MTTRTARSPRPTRTPATTGDLLTPKQLDNYADVMIWALRDARAATGDGAVYSPGDIIMLQYQPSAGSLAERIYARLLDAGFHVKLQPMPHFAMDKIYYDHAQGGQLDLIMPGTKELYGRINGRIVLTAPDSLTHLAGCDPAKMARSSLAAKPLQKIVDRREAAGLYGWTLCMLPTAALAAQAQLTLPEYAAEIVKACYLDQPDPIAKWRDTMAKIGQVKDWLTSLPIEHVHVQSEDGETDLKVWLGEKRRWLGGSGHNIPSFEVFTSPEAGRAEGRFHANEASFKLGRYVRGVRLEFAGGRVVKATAEAEEEFVRSRVNLDKGSCLIGEFSLTDRRFSEITRFMASTLFDENVGGRNGNTHIAIGRAYTDAYAGPEKMTPALAKKLKFSDSSEHWDLVATTPRVVTAHLRGGGTQVIYRDGQFTCF